VGALEEADLLPQAGWGISPAFPLPRTHCTPSLLHLLHALFIPFLPAPRQKEGKRHGLKRRKAWGFAHKRGRGKGIWVQAFSRTAGAGWRKGGWMEKPSAMTLRVDCFCLEQEG